MGIEKGSVVIWDYKYWLFAGYDTNENMEETYILHGLHGEVISPSSKECTFLIAVSEMEL